MKPLLKMPALNRNWLMMAGAITLGIVAVFLSNRLLQDHMASVDAQLKGAHKMISVVVAKRDMAKGTPIQPGDFAVRPIPQEYLQSSAIDADHFGEFVGQRLGAPVRHGEALLTVHMESTTAVFSSTLEKGNRGLTTEVDEVNSISGLLRPSDRIDLMATARSSAKDAQDTTFPLLTNVEVLATGQVTRKSDGTNQPHTYTTITLSVNPEDAQRIIVAKNSGRLTAVLRNPEDTHSDTSRAMNIDDVVPKKPRTPGTMAVQYIIGGHS